MLIVALLIRLSEHKQAAQTLASQQKKYHVEEMKAIAADTTIKAELRNEIDTVRTQLIQANREANRARIERDKLLKRTQSIKNDTEAIRGRSQKPPNTPPVEPQKDEPKKGLFKRIFGSRAPSHFDSLGTVAQY